LLPIALASAPAMAGSEAFGTRAVRGEVTVTRAVSPGGAVSASQTFGRFLAVEGTAGVVGMVATTAADLSVLGRTGLFGMGTPHALSLGVGPRLLVGSAHGPVALAQVDLAYEYRPVRNVSFVAGAGIYSVLNKSRHVDCPFLEFACVSQFYRGDGGFRFRVGVGYSF
jgi:hypothetical protein